MSTIQGNIQACMNVMMFACEHTCLCKFMYLFVLTQSLKKSESQPLQGEKEYHVLSVISHTT